MKRNNLTVKFAHSQHVMYLIPDIGFLLGVDMAICEVRISGLTDTGSNTSGSHYTLRTVRTHMGRGPRSTLARLAAGQARYRRMVNRLGPLQLKVNPGSEGLAGRSTWSQDAARHDPSQRVPSCDKESGLYGLTPTASRRWSHQNLAMTRVANLSPRGLTSTKTVVSQRGCWTSRIKK